MAHVAVIAPPAVRAAFARLVEEGAGGDRLGHGGQYLAEARVRGQLRAAQREAPVGGAFADVVQLGAAFGHLGLLQVGGGVQVDRQLQGAARAVADCGIAPAGAGLVIHDARAAGAAVDAVDAPGEPQPPVAGRDRHAAKLPFGGDRLPGAAARRVRSVRCAGLPLLLLQIGGQFLLHLAANQVPGERQPGDAGRQLGEAPLHDLRQRRIGAVQKLRPGGAGCRTGKKPLHQLVEDGVHQVAALQGRDLQGLLRFAAGADAQHLGEEEAIGTHREVLQRGGGQIALQGAAGGYQRGRNDAVERAEAARAALRLLGADRVDGGPQRFDRGHGRLAARALLQHVPAQVGCIERPQRGIGAGAGESDARRQALVPVAGVPLQRRGGEKAAGQVAHFFEQEAGGQPHVGRAGAAPRVGEGEAFAGSLTGQLEQQPLLLEPLPLERQVAGVAGAAVELLPLGVQQQRVLANDRRKGAFGAAGDVYAPKAHQAGAHHVADEHPAALEVAAAHAGLANGGLGGLAEPLGGGGDGAAAGGGLVEYRQFADAVGDRLPFVAAGRRRHEPRQQLQKAAGMLLPGGRGQRLLRGARQRAHHGVQFARRGQRFRGALLVGAGRGLAAVKGEHRVELLPPLDQSQLLAQRFPARRARRQRGSAGGGLGLGFDPGQVDPGQREQLQQRAAARFGIEQLQQVEGSPSYG